MSLARILFPLIAFVLAGAVLLAPIRSLAGLGGPESSIRADSHALQGRHSVISSDGYTVHEINLGGTRVREYALPDGAVFAVSWQGLAQPDLSVLLGAYYREYEESESRLESRPGREPRTLRLRNLVVQRWGHMRDIRGKAYVPGLLPRGFTPEEIR